MQKRQVLVLVVLVICSIQASNAGLSTVQQPSIQMLNQTSSGLYNIYYPGQNGTNTVLSLTSMYMQDVSTQNVYFSIGEEENNDTICVGKFWQTDNIQYSLIYPQFLCNATPVCQVQELTFDDAVTTNFDNSKYGYAGKVFLDSYSVSVQQYIGRINDMGIKPSTIILYFDPVDGTFLGAVYPQTETFTGQEVNVPYFTDFFFNNVTTDTPDASFFELPESCVYEAAVTFEAKKLAAELEELNSDISQLVQQLKTYQKQQEKEKAEQQKAQAEAEKKKKKEDDDEKAQQQKSIEDQENGNYSGLYDSALNAYLNNSGASSSASQQFQRFITKKKLNFRGSIFQQEEEVEEDNSTNTTDSNTIASANETNSSIEVDPAVLQHEKIQELNQLKQNLTDLKQELEDAMNNIQNVTQEDIDNYQAEWQELEEEGESLGVVSKAKKSKKGSKKDSKTKKDKKTQKGKKGKKDEKGKKSKKSEKNKKSKQDKKNDKKGQSEKSKGKKDKKGKKTEKKSKKEKKNGKKSKKQKKSNKKKLMFEQHLNSNQIKVLHEKVNWAQKEKQWIHNILENKINQ